MSHADFEEAERRCVVAVLAILISPKAAPELKLAYRDPLKRALADKESREEIVKDLTRPPYDRLGLASEEIGKAVEQVRKDVEKEG